MQNIPLIRSKFTGSVFVIFCLCFVGLKHWWNFDNFENALTSKRSNSDSVSANKYDDDMLTSRSKGELRLPVKAFQYFRLHKTGSKRTQTILQRFCRRNKLRCLDFDFCGGLKKLRDCWNDGTFDNLDPLVWVTDATFTYERLKRCCPRSLKKKFDGVQEHVWLRDPNMKSFLNGTNVIKSASSRPFRFTILRNPVDQLLSYFEYISRHTHPFYQQMKNATKAIEMKGQNDEYVGLADFLFKLMKNSSYSNDKVLLNLSDLITNSQAKELGWSGKKNDLKKTVNFLETLDFVGISEELPEIYESILPEKLGWDHDLYFIDDVITKHYFCTRKTREKLKAVQYADMKLYARTRALYYRHRHASRKRKRRHI